ncbi:hypothetical protein GCM10025859_34410 [Alicyclobacillus fastidiosus]|nr:hypothetical protein GCM10025859_34410 [Alicyclobacillus fastidiosus]
MNVDVIEGNFEEWEPQTAKCFDLVFTATAWNWIDPEVKYVKAWQVLRRGGHLTFWNATHVFPEHEDPFFREIQDVYDELGVGRPKDINYPRPVNCRSTEVKLKRVVYLT